ncbi:MAG: hypothetical protein R3E39_26455 [Anaerolineae bacterium]
MQNGQHVPTLIAEGQHDVMSLQLVDLAPSHELRLLQMQVAGYAMSQRSHIGSLRQLFFMSEAWMSTQSGDKPLQSPSQDPQRIEVLTIANLKLQEHAVQMKVFEMLRDNSGNLTGVRAQEVAADGQPISGESPLLEAFVAGFLFGQHPTSPLQ